MKITFNFLIHYVYILIIDIILHPRADNANNKNDGIQKSPAQLDKTYSSSAIISSDACTTKHKRKSNTDKTGKTKKCKRKESNNVEAPTDARLNIVAHVEQSVREWITEDTQCHLLGEGEERDQLLEKLMQQKRYQKLCKKLNTLQLEDQLKDCAKLGIETRNSLLQVSVLLNRFKIFG